MNLAEYAILLRLKIELVSVIATTNPWKVDLRPFSSTSPEFREI